MPSRSTLVTDRLVARDVRCPTCGAALDPETVDPSYNFGDDGMLGNVRWTRSFVRCVAGHRLTITVDKDFEGRAREKVIEIYP